MCGRIPEGWKEELLTNLVTSRRGTEPGSASYCGTEEGVRFLRVGDLSGKTDNPVFANAKGLLRIESNDILFVLDGSPGLVAKGYTGAISSGIRLIKLKNPNSTEDFLFYALQSPKVQLTIEAYTTGSTILHAGRALQFIRIDLPSLPEQKKIAAILSSVDKAIEKTKAVIEQTKVVKKCLLQELFTRGIPGRHKRFKKTSVGEIPEAWEVVKLEKVAKVERGKFQHRPRNEPRFYGGRYPFVQTGDVTNSDGRIRSYSQTLNDEGLAISKLFSKGTILFTIAANIGETAIAEFALAFPDSLIGIIAKDSLNTKFLEYYLRTRKADFNRLATESTQKNINLGILLPYPVVVPSKEEQNIIADFLENIDEKERTENKCLEGFQNLKKALMQVLLT